MVKDIKIPFPALKISKSQFQFYPSGVGCTKAGSAIHWIAIFSTFVKLAVDRYNLRLRFCIYKLKFLKSIVGSRSVVSQLFG